MTARSRRSSVGQGGYQNPNTPHPPDPRYLICGFFFGGGMENGQDCLFGWQHSPRKGMRGRPAHVPNNETCNKIKLLLALGWANERIARALGITLPTLRKHYFSLLRVRDLARDAMDARRVERLWLAAEKGNIGAEKELGRFIVENDRRLIGDDLQGGKANASSHDGSLKGAQRSKVEDHMPDLPSLPLPAGGVEGKKAAARSGAASLIAGDDDLMAPPKSQRPN